MKVRVVAVGKVKEPLREIADQYAKRAAHYWRLEVDEVRAGSASGTAEDVMREEGGRLLAACRGATAIWLVTRDGKQLSSEQLSQKLANRALHSEAEIALLVGGAFGFSDEVRDHAKGTISLSRFTLPHDLARAVLLEQLYRAGTILRGEPYHKGPNSG